MNERELELLMKEDIESIFTNILKEHNYIFPISAKSRSGAEISDYLEDGFVEYLNRNAHNRIYNPKGAPKGATKNPFDFCFNYNLNSALNYNEGLKLLKIAGLQKCIVIKIITRACLKRP